MRPIKLDPPNNRELCKQRLKPINRLIRWAIQAGDVKAHTHYVERSIHEYNAYHYGLGIYSNYKF